MNKKSSIFNELVNNISEIGYDLHEQTLLDNAKSNLKYGVKTTKNLPKLLGEKAQSAIIVSAGPSIHQKKHIEQILSAEYKGTIICVDGSYVSCLKKGLYPDFMVTLDPHKTRLVRWFGDHDFEKHVVNDDYFARQDLNVNFRENSIKHNKENIHLVNEHGYRTKAIIASSSPSNVRDRIIEASLDSYWWNPLVDNPHKVNSLTRRLYAINKWPCMNTGGNVGTAAWVLASSVLGIPDIAILGVDLGYYISTPKKHTQLYYELIEHIKDKEKLDECFVDFEFPLTGEKFYTDPTYFWYRKNFLELLEGQSGNTYNCTEGGTVFSENITCEYLKNFLNMMS